MNDSDELSTVQTIHSYVRADKKEPEKMMLQGFEGVASFPRFALQIGGKCAEDLCIHAAVMKWISTLSTWFSTEKAAVLLEKTHLCGKTNVEYAVHNGFSTCGAIVENHMLFVENPRKSL